MPIIRHDSPYYTPLSLPVWHILTGTRYLVYWFLRWSNRSPVGYRSDSYRRYLCRQRSCRKSLVQGIQKTAEETALKSPLEIDIGAFMWTFECLDEDHELERFFFGLPGFRSSKVVKDPLPHLTIEEKSRLYGALEGLLSRTFSSNLLPVPIKNRRAMICAKAIDPEHTPDASDILHETLFHYDFTDPMATGIAKILRGYANNVDGNDASRHAQLTVSRVMTATRQSYDDSWYSLASDEVAIPQVVLRDYAAHGDSLSLLNLTYVTRLQFSHFRKSSWPKLGFSSVLEKASNFDVKDTLPTLRHEFCALWNQIVNEVHDDNNRGMVSYILRPIRNVFLALHQDTDSAATHFSTSTNDIDPTLRAPSSYPLCKVPGHHPESPPRIHDDYASKFFPPSIPDDHHNIALVPSLPNPDPPSSSTHAPLPIDKSLTDAPPVDNISLPVQITPEYFRIPSSSRTMHLSTSEPSTSGPPSKLNASASPPDDVADERRTKRSRAPSDDLNVRSSPSPTPVLDATLPTGLLSLFSGRDSI